MKLRLYSLRARFIVAIFLWTTLGTATIWYSSTRLFEIHVAQQYHEELEVHVRELDALTRLDASGQPYLSRPLSDPRFSVPMAGFYWQITRDGYAPVRSLSLKRGDLDDSIARWPLVTHRLESGPTGEAIAYGLIRKLDDGDDLHFVIATDQRLLDQITSQFERELTIWLAILATLLLASGGIIIWFGLRPLELLGQAIAKLRNGEASDIDGRFPSEIAPLVNDLNAYINSNDTLIMNARTQAANLAHALRTPLAVMTDEAERVKLGNPASGVAETILEQCQLMTQQIEYQLARSRSATGQMRPGGSCQPCEVMAPLISAMRRLHPEKEFALSCNVPDKMQIGLDEVACREMVACVLDNAGKWANLNINCNLNAVENQIVIDIEDDGPGMTPDQAKKAFEIGSRFDKCKPGSGLGLAIAQDIASNIGGEALIVSGDNILGGLHVRISLPVFA